MPPVKSVTLKHLAKLLRVSVSTVNAALHDRADISPATKKRVLEKARELNYRPNLVARSLVTRRTQVIGVVVPDLTRSFFGEVIKGIEQVASAENYYLLLCNTGEDPRREDVEVDALLSKQVDGLLIASAYPSGSVLLRNRLSCTGVPYVLVDRFFPSAHFVGGDDVRIGYIATQHLLQQGYRRIAHLRGPRVSTAIGRMQGYQKAIREAGMPIRDDYIVEAPYHEELGAFDGMRKLLRVSPQPDAVFAASDPIAIGALEAIIQKGIRVPGEIGVIGVGNHRYGQYLRVPLSTVDQDRLTIGRRAATLLLRVIEGKQGQKPRVIMVNPKVIIRNSSRRSMAPAAEPIGGLYKMPARKNINTLPLPS
jgi:LacI family transcriptional regulator